MEPKIGAIIQARMSSTRLPGKVLKDLYGKTVLEHIIDRVSRSKYIKQIIVATTTNPADDQIVKKLKGTNTPTFRGDEDNVLSRFYLAAKKYKLDIIVRITADDPLKDPNVIDQLIEILLGNDELDYCSNTIKPTFPEGIDCEVFRFKALEKAFKEAKLSSETEHVTPYIWKNPDKFNTYNLEYSRDLSSWRWTLDNPDDWEFFKAVYGQFYKEDSFFGMEDVIPWLEEHPEIVELNNKTARNEGYLKSLQNDEEQQEDEEQQ